MARTWAERLIAGGVFLLLFGGYLLWVKGPAANHPQQVFRMAVPALGLLLAVVGLILKASRGRGGAA